MRQFRMDMADPRIFPARSDARFDVPLQLAADSIASGGVIRAGEIDTMLVDVLVQSLRAGGGDYLSALMKAAPSPPVARQLQRRLIDAWSVASRSSRRDQLAATIFALPLIIVAGSSADDQHSSVDPASDQAHAPMSIAGTVPDLVRITAILREYHALSGNQTFSMAASLASPLTLEIERLPGLLAWQFDAATTAIGRLDIAPAPIAITTGQETVHLRFLIGAALAASNADLLAETTTGGWAMPLASELSRQLAVDGASVLVLPRAPQTPLSALLQGRAAHREIGAQLFASNAIRRLRAEVGEPSAVISAHRCASAVGGGELRLSLSSVFDPRRAEGFRCPLFPGERVDDVAQMLEDLLRDCRITDVSARTGVHPDRDPETGMTLLFKADVTDDPRHPRVH